MALSNVFQRRGLRFELVMAAAKAVALAVLWAAVVEIVEEDLVMPAILHGWQSEKLWHSPISLTWVYYGPIVPIAIFAQWRSFSSIAQRQRKLVAKVLAIAATAALMYLGTMSATGYPSIRSSIFQPSVQF